MSDLTDHVADALFQTELPLEPGTDSYLGRPAATHLATVALQAARAQGWRIVKTDECERMDCNAQHEHLIEEWAP